VVAEYAYRAADASGVTRDGSLQAASRDAALRQLRARGLTPLRLVEGAAGAPTAPAAGGAAPGALHKPLAWRGRDRGPNAADVHHLTNELAVMLRAGLPLDRALRVQVGMSAKPSLGALKTCSRRSTPARA
jgi:general secretion pathway protein F